MARIFVDMDGTLAVWNAGITYDTTDALEALGLTAEEIAADERLKKGLALAHSQIMGVD